MGKTRVADLAIAVTTNADQASASMNAMFKSAAAEGKKFERTMAAVSMVGKKFEAAGKIMSVAVTLPLVMAAGAATKLAMSAVESENLFEVSMGSMAASARAWSLDISKSLGLNSYDVRKFVGTFNVMLGSMGLGSQAALTWSERMTQMAYDASSFYNVPLPEMFAKIQSGISGEVEPLKRLGILIDVATVKEYAYAQGIAKRGEEMTNEQKVTARLGLIMQQMSKAQGDLARTMDSPANKLRALTARFQEAGIELGTRLLPYVIQGADSLIRLADAFIALSPAAQKTILAIAAAAAVIGPFLFISGKLAQSVVALNAAKVIFSALLRGRVIPSVVAETVSVGLNTAALTANTTASGLNATAQRMLAGASGVSATSFGLNATAQRMFADASRTSAINVGNVTEVLGAGIIVSERAAGKLGKLTPAVSGLAAAWAANATWLVPVALGIAAVAAVFGVIYLATKKWGGESAKIVDSTTRFRYSIDETTKDLDTHAVTVRQATAASRGYSEQLEVLEAASGNAAREQNNLAKSIDGVAASLAEQAAAREAQWASYVASTLGAEGTPEWIAEQKKYLADRINFAQQAQAEYNAALQPLLAQPQAELTKAQVKQRDALSQSILDKANEIRALQGELAGVGQGGPGGGGGDLPELSSALSVISDELAIGAAEWKLWAAEFSGVETDLKFQVAWADQLATKMSDLRNAIASVSLMKGKDSDETRELTKYLLDLRTQLAETTKEYLAAKAAMAVPSATQTQWFEQAATMAGPAGLDFDAAIQQYIAMWAKSGVTKSAEEARAAIFGTFGPIPGAATGADITSPGLVKVGEKGTEIVSLPRGATVTPLSQSSRSYGPFIFHFNGSPAAGVTTRDIERGVRRVMEEMASHA